MVNVFMVNSSSDRDEAIRVKAYLEQADSSGRRYAKVRILEHPLSSWHEEFKRTLKETHLVLFLQGEHSAESKNIQWEIELALEAKKAVVVCQINDISIPLPDWLQEKDAFTGKTVSKAEVCSLADVKERIMRYDRKEYDIFSKAYQSRLSQAAETDTDKERLFEQYKLYQATSEAVVERRQTVSNLYIIINGAFLTVIGTVFAAEKDSLDILMKLLVSWIMSVGGIILNYAWQQIIKSYGLLNQHKIQALYLIEEHLPLRLYAAEWEIMDDKMNPKKYKSFTSTEILTPILFLWLYVLIILMGIGYRFGWLMLIWVVKARIKCKKFIPVICVVIILICTCCLAYQFRLLSK